MARQGVDANYLRDQPEEVEALVVADGRRFVNAGRVLMLGGGALSSPSRPRRGTGRMLPAPCTRSSASSCGCSACPSSRSCPWRAGSQGPRGLAPPCQQPSSH
ncbi:unnamed protein product [Urochloa humidicola]